MLEIIKDTLMDGIKLLPFLLITYIIMEYIEHKMGHKSKELIKKSDKFGPIIGGILGIFPQCGFSVSATNLYAGRVITLGTLIAVYLSTSDEMLPILISEAVSPIVILKILGIKMVIGILGGVLVDLFIRIGAKRKNKKNQSEAKNSKIENVMREEEHRCEHECDEREEAIGHLCEEEHCHCEKDGILKSACKHTLNIFLFILIITFIINTVVHFIGEENIAHLLLNKTIIGPIIAALIGLIPNCAASVILTDMYLENLISVSSLIAGLLTGAGVGLAVLFKTNKGVKNNLKIAGILYGIGVFSGILLELIGLQI